MIFGVALEVLRKQSNCWDKITECSANCEECECHVDASDLVEAVRTVLDAFGNCSELPNTSQTKFKPGDKFLLEIGEKRIGLDEYSIVGTDLYVWGSLLEKLTPYEPNGDAISRQAAIELTMQYCPDDDGACSKADCDIRELLDDIEALPSVQADQKWIPCKKKLPEESNTYIATLIDDGGYFTDVVEWNSTFGGRWQSVFYDDSPIGEYHDISNVIAWKPLPEPYRGDTE